MRSLSPLETACKKSDVVLTYGEHTLTEWGMSVSISKTHVSLHDTAFTMTVNESVIKKGLILRTRRPGDKIKLQGMQGKSKVLKKLLSEMKLSSDEKDNLPLIASGDEVLWLVGKRKSRYQIEQGIVGEFAQITVNSL